MCPQKHLTHKGLREILQGYWRYSFCLFHINEWTYVTSSLVYCLAQQWRENRPRTTISPELPTRYMFSHSCCCQSFSFVVGHFVWCYLMTESICTIAIDQSNTGTAFVLSNQHGLALRSPIHYGRSTIEGFRFRCFDILNIHSHICNIWKFPILRKANATFGLTEILNVLKEALSFNIKLD